MPRDPRAYSYTFPISQDLAFDQACIQAQQQILQDIQALHDEAIRLYGGSLGIRSPELLRSAIARPFTTLGSAYAYPTGIIQAAALLQSIVLNHPFVDGNKRAGFTACLYFLQECHYWRDIIFLSMYELRGLENLILRIAGAGTPDDAILATSAGIEIIAGELGALLGPSRRRRIRLSRLLSGAFVLFGES